jgi:hypothetical protein
MDSRRLCMVSSGSGSLAGRTAAQACLADRWWDIGRRVWHSDVGSGRNDLVDLVEHVIGKNHLGTRE